MTAPSVTRRSAGFTLIELLVSLALMALATGLLIAALTTGRTLAARAATGTDATESVVAAQMLLRTRIEAMRAEARFDASAPYADVRGDAFRLSFSAPAPDALRPAPEQRYRLLLLQGALMLYHVDPLRRGINTDDPSVKGWTAATLLRGVRDFDIAYFGVGPPDNMRRWRPFWQDRPRLPELVRVRVRFAAGDARRWPDLIVRPLASVNAACRLDPVTGDCRVAGR